MNVIESIYNEPEKWRQGEYTFKHEGGAEIWTSKIPIFNTNMYPEVQMSFFKKIQLWRAIRWWANNAPLAAFNHK